MYCRTVLSASPNHTDALNNVGKCLSELASRESADAVGLGNHAFSTWMRVLEVDKNHRMARMNAALHLHSAGLFLEAVVHWNVLLAAHPNDAEVAYNAAVSFQYLGRIEDAAEAYMTAIRVKTSYTEALINLAALHHRYGSISEAVHLYREAIETANAKAENQDLLIMVYNNLGVAQVQLGLFEDAMESHRHALALAEHYASLRGDSKYFNDVELTHGLILKASIPGCYWENRDKIVRSIVNQDSVRIDRGDGPVLLPFDTLLLPIDGMTRMRVARAQSSTFEHHQIDVPTRYGDESIMRVSYLCYDFNDHPTAHLVEGLFRWHKRFKKIRGENDGVHAAAINYGKDDNSTYRASIAADADAFINLNTLGHREAVEEARRWPVGGPSIAVDLQGHTLGTRMELVAMRVAPVQASYLIFPGTSGASFIDSLFVDKHVVPPEHTATYSEKMIYLPGCYQINDYERHLIDSGGDVDAIRRSHGLPAKPAVVFCNFNKSDKLDPVSFAVWMSVLRRVPGSALWLLKPSKQRAFDALKSNLNAQAAAHGVMPSRIVWATRVPKAAHLGRHTAADLFLDTFVYGAHSTATDALRGGLPFLTARGGTFPQRVGVSLLSNVIGSLRLLLECDSLRDFEDLAVALTTTNRATLYRLRQHLVENSQTARLFDTARFTDSMERAYKAMWEIYRADGNQTTRHLVIADAKDEQQHSLGFRRKSWQ